MLINHSNLHVFPVHYPLRWMACHTDKIMSTWRLATLGLALPQVCQGQEDQSSLPDLQDPTQFVAVGLKTKVTLGKGLHLQLKAAYISMKRENIHSVTSLGRFTMLDALLKEIDAYSVWVQPVRES